MIPPRISVGIAFSLFHGLFPRLPEVTLGISSNFSQDFFQATYKNFFQNFFVYTFRDLFRSTSQDLFMIIPRILFDSPSLFSSGIPSGILGNPKLIYFGIPSGILVGIPPAIH